ncbi:MAG: cyclase family protein [Firmicutes bacterium]|nr:cyclase family protein [Bacillota bacterium]
MLQVFDISLLIYPGMAVWKDRQEKRPSVRITRDFAADGIRESRLELDSHTGTHVDAPLHMMPGGSSIDQLSGPQLVGPGRVLDLTAVQDHIGRTDLEPYARVIQPGEFVLLKTANSPGPPFDPHFVFLAEDGAAFLAGLGVRGVGIDALGIERDQPGHPTHRILFQHGVTILEGLRLRHVPAGSYLLVAAPLLVAGGDAAPARVFLLGEGAKEGRIPQEIVE